MFRYLISKIAIAIYVLLITAVVFFGYRTYKTQNSTSISQPEQQEQSAKNDFIDGQQDNVNNSDQNTITNQPELNENTNSPQTNAPASNAQIDPKNVLAHITPQHCDDGCKAFKIDLSLFEYCEQACGISPVKKVSSCDGKSGIQKDYCLKDLAIGKNDASQCNKIKDDNIKNACNAIIEENTFRQMQQETSGQRENPSF